MLQTVAERVISASPVAMASLLRGDDQYPEERPQFFAMRRASRPPNQMADKSVSQHIHDHIYTPAGEPWMYSPRKGDNGAGVAADHDAFTAGNPPAPNGRQVAFLQGTGSSISQVVSGFSPG
jgi:hypothetical protein